MEFPGVVSDEATELYFFFTNILSHGSRMEKIFSEFSSKFTEFQ
jgi:hypothetical protein